MTQFCCSLTVTESGEGMSCILLSILLLSGVSNIRKGGDRGGEYFIELTVCRSINSSFTK